MEKRLASIPKLHRNGVNQKLYLDAARPRNLDPYSGHGFLRGGKINIILINYSDAESLFH